MYILKCADNSYYTGSTTNLELRLKQHQSGKGANHTKKRLPVELVYYEEYSRIDEAFYREKQVQGWNRKKKEALINGENNLLPELAIAYRDKNGGFEILSHRKNALPEALEGSVETLSHRKNALPEALEGSVETLSHRENTLPEAHEGSGETLSHRENTLPEAHEGSGETLSHRENTLPEALEGSGVKVLV
jgi:putative endonuclease